MDWYYNRRNVPRPVTEPLTPSSNVVGLGTAHYWCYTASSDKGLGTVDYWCSTVSTAQAMVQPTIGVVQRVQIGLGTADHWRSTASTAQALAQPTIGVAQRVQPMPSYSTHID